MDKNVYCAGRWIDTNMCRLHATIFERMLKHSKFVLYVFAASGSSKFSVVLQGEWRHCEETC